MPRVVFFCVLSLASAFAQQQAASDSKPLEPKPEKQEQCPIEFVKIDPTGNESVSNVVFGGKSAEGRNGKMFVLKVKNVSGKEIRGMKFQAAYYDATEDLHDIPIAWNWTDSMKPDAEKAYRWDNDLWRDKSLLGWRVRLLKVLFEDGTKWEPSTLEGCKGEFWRNKKRPKTAN